MQQTSEKLGQLSVPFPETPVGVGAHWRVTNRVELSGFKLKRVSDFRLRQRDNQRMTVDVQVRQELLDRHVQMPGVPGPIKVTTFESHGTGKMVQDLDHLIPMQSSAEIMMRMAMETQAFGQPQTLDMAMEFGTTVIRDKASLSPG